jgi:O-antigen ligase
MTNIPFSISAAPNQELTPEEVHPPFWQDRYACLLFCCLMALVSIAVELGPLSSIAKSLRWVILAVLAVPGLRHLSQLSGRALSPEHRFLFGLMVIALISCFYSVMPIYSFERLGSFLLLWVALFSGAWVWLRRDVRNLFSGFDILYVLVVVVTIVTAFYTGQEGITDRSERANGAFDKATGAGNFAAFAIPIILYKVHQLSGRWHWFAVAMLVVQVYVLFFSGARAALISTLIGTGVLVWMLFRRYRPLVTVTVGGGLLAAVVAGSGLDVLPDYVVRTESIATMTGRLDRFKALMHVWQKEPIQGYGYGVSRFMIARDGDALEIYLEAQGNTRAAGLLRAASARGPVEIHSHSDHIERLVETGIIGYVAFAGFLVALLRRIPRALRRPRTPLNNLVLVLLAAVWPTVVDTVTHSAMFAVGNGPMVVCWFLIVLTIAADTAAEARMRDLDGNEVGDLGELMATAQY